MLDVKTNQFDTNKHHVEVYDKLYKNWVLLGRNTNEDFSNATTLRIYQLGRVALSK